MKKRNKGRKVGVQSCVSDLSANRRNITSSVFQIKYLAKNDI